MQKRIAMPEVFKKGILKVDWLQRRCGPGTSGLTVGSGEADWSSRLNFLLKLH